eukprot:SAG31_NODE_34_length_31842_cov_31.677850_14_plen_122_part_00
MCLTTSDVELLGTVEASLRESRSRTGNRAHPGILGQFSLADIPLAVELNRWSLCIHAARRDAASMKKMPLPENGRKLAPPEADFRELQLFYSAMLLRPPFIANVFQPGSLHLKYRQCCHTS